MTFSELQTSGFFEGAFPLRRLANCVNTAVCLLHALSSFYTAVNASFFPIDYVSFMFISWLLTTTVRMIDLTVFNKFVVEFFNFKLILAYCVIFYGSLYNSTVFYCILFCTILQHNLVQSVQSSLNTKPLIRKWSRAKKKKRKCAPDPRGSDCSSVLIDEVNYWGKTQKQGHSLPRIENTAKSKHLH